MSSFAQVIAKAIAFVSMARLSICFWNEQNWSVFVTSLFYNAWCQHWMQAVKLGMQYGKLITDERF